MGADSGAILELSMGSPGSVFDQQPHAVNNVMPALMVKIRDCRNLRRKQAITYIGGAAQIIRIIRIFVDMGIAINARYGSKSKNPG